MIDFKTIGFSSLVLLSTALRSSECPNVDFRCQNGRFPLHVTFDDGPAPQSPNILKTLREFNVRGTFFLQGEKLITPDGKNFKSPKTAEYLRQVRSEGHLIASHTYHHIRHLSEAQKNNKYQIDGEMLKKSRLTWKDNFEVMKRPGPLQEFMTDEGKQYIRLPYGQGWFKASNKPAPDAVVLKELLRKTNPDATPIHVGWNIDPADWTNPTPQQYLTTLRDQICQDGGGIILMHDHTRATNQNLACFLRLAQEAGHKFLDRPDSFTKYRDGANGPKVVMRYEDIPGIHRAPEQDCDESTDRQDRVDQLEDSAVQILHHLRSDESYTRGE